MVGKLHMLCRRLQEGNHLKWEINGDIMDILWVSWGYMDGCVDEYGDIPSGKVT